MISSVRAGCAVSVLALVPAASANVVQLSGTISGGPTGTAQVVALGGVVSQPFSYSNLGVNVSGTSIASLNANIPDLYYATGGFSSAALAINTSSAVDITLTGTYEFASGPVFNGPATFPSIDFTGNSRGRQLTMTYSAVVEGMNASPHTMWDGALPGSFQSGYHPSSQSFPGTTPTVTMTISLRVQVAAGANDVNVDFSDYTQRMVWLIPSPGVAGMMGVGGLCVMRRRRS